MQHTSKTSIYQRSTRTAASPWILGAGAVALGLAGAALVNTFAARRAESMNPPRGRFIDVKGVKLHYLEAGSGEPLVMLHGNGSTTDELDASGLIEEASHRYRVLAFDRPGFGYSERPRGVVWSAARQADLIAAAMERLGVQSAIVFAHSWGSLVAMNLALRHPQRVRALALESGYYFATLRADAFLMAPPAIPLVGDVIVTALSPLIGRLTWERQIRKMFDPAPIPNKFRAYSPQMALRPSQLRASAEESALMIWEARALEEEYVKIRVPLVLLAGEGDQIANVDRQSRELHEVMPTSILRVIRGVGHMVHQTDPRAALAAIDDAARLSQRGVAQAAEPMGATAGA